MVIIFIIGIFVGIITQALLNILSADMLRRMKAYFGSPLDESFDIDWAGRQFFLLFGKAPSERWYEARAHLGCGVLISLLCMLRLIHVVRYGCYSEEYGVSFFRSKIRRYHGFRNNKKLDAIIKTEMELANSYDLHPFTLVDQVFVAGRNVVYRF